MKLPILLGILLVAPTAVAALPALCGPACDITAAVTGYDPVVAVIPDGGVVTWTTADITHVQQEVRFGADACFTVYHDQDVPTTAPVRFDIVGASLVAEVDGEPTECTGAVGGPAGFTLQYFCVLHPTMRGTLVVAG